MEKEKKKNCRPLAAERAATAVLSDLLSEGSLHGARIFLSLSYKDPTVYL